MEWWLLGLAVLLALGSAFFVVGQIFGLAAIPKLVEKTGWKYGLLLVSMMIPPIGAVVCLLNYKETRYASRFIVVGAVFLLVACLIYIRVIRPAVTG